MEIKSNTSRISKYYSLPSLNQTEQQERLLPEDKLYTTSHHMVCPQFIFGIEVEAENVEGTKIKYKHYPYWNITIDNSLRNNGLEFVSLPLKASQLEGALIQLNASLSPMVEFTPRTSVHVHMNVRDLSLEQITSLLLLYTTVEELLFNWVGHNRDKSVFCIKLTETDYVQNYINLNNDPNYTIPIWNKYTAFNIAPLESKGTVEFRHMEGTANITRILTWINFLSCLKRAAKATTLHRLIHTIGDLNTSSTYEMYIQDIFGDLAYLLTHNILNLQKAMEESVSYVKLATIQKEAPKKISQNQDQTNRPIITFDDWIIEPTTPQQNTVRQTTTDILTNNPIPRPTYQTRPLPPEELTNIGPPFTQQQRITRMDII